MKNLLILILLFLKMTLLNAQHTKGVYYVSGRPGEHGIWLSTLDSATGTWNRGDKVLLNGVFDGDAVDPDVVLLSNHTYRLYYYKGYFVTPPPPPPHGPRKIYSADSQDGVNFTINGVAFEHHSITDPSIVELPNGNYLMACAMIGQTTIQSIISLSIDGGLTFDSLTTIQDTGIPELFVLSDGSVRIFYNGSGGIISSRSYDNGVTWNTESGLRLSTTEFIGDPSIVKVENNKWLLFVKGFNSSGDPTPTGHKIMLAESNDETNTFNLIQPLILDSASVPEGVFISNPNTSVEENQLLTFQNEEILLYPNPASKHTTIEFSFHNYSNCLIRLYNAQGQLLKTISNINTSKVHLDTQNLTEGIYFIQLETNQQIIKTAKMIITE